MSEDYDEEGQVEVVESTGPSEGEFLSEVQAREKEVTRLLNG